ncbi:MAG: arsenic efflux protein [Ignavibacteriales bacterium]|nr:arsenic efflux protein [Ignavibacteriales bacterium]
MFEELSGIVVETLKISLLVMVMMIVVDLLNVLTRKKLRTFFREKKKLVQYISASFIGALPGCIGGFTNVSLYVHGIISFGALAGSMIAVSGDEAFVMLAMFPQEAAILFVILFVIGVAGSYIIDYTVKKFQIKTCDNCTEMVVHEHSHGVKHYIKEHVWAHIIKKHLIRTSLWTFGALLVVHFGLKYFDLSSFTSEYKIVFLFLGALVGLIPESGPHLIFVTLFAQGLVPFSVLLTSSIVQDGHGMLPMLSYSLKDALKIKLFNFTIGLILGLILFSCRFLARFNHSPIFGCYTSIHAPFFDI